MKLIRSALLILASFLTIVLFPAAASAAYDPLGDACTIPGAVTSAGCGIPQEKVSGSGGILAKITKIVSILAGMAAIILVIISGMFFVLADGDAAKIKGARDTLLGAVVGVVVVVASQAILTFVLRRI